MNNKVKEALGSASYLTYRLYKSTYSKTSSEEIRKTYKVKTHVLLT